MSAPFGAIRPDGSWSIPPRYEVLRPFSEGLAVFVHEGRTGLVDGSGRERFGLPEHVDLDELQGGRLAFAIEPSRLDALVPEGEAAFIAPSPLSRLVGTLGRWVGRLRGRATRRHGYLDATGRAVITPEYQDVEPFSEGLGAVQVGELWGFVDPNGQRRIAPTFRWIEPFSEGLACAGDELEGYIDARGEWVIPARFPGASSFSEGLAAVEDEDERWGYIDRAGTLVVPARYALASEFACGRASVYLDEDLEQAALIDRVGKIVFEAEEDDALGDYSEDLCGVERDDLHGWLGLDGTWAIAPRFCDGGDFVGGLAPAQDDAGRWGYIDPSGAWVLPPQFGQAGEFVDGLAIVRP